MTLGTVDGDLNVVGNFTAGNGAVVFTAADLTALPAIAVALVPEGQLVEVTTLLDQFVLVDDATTLAAADGITIVAPTVAAGNKVWVRRNLGNGKWRLRTDWFVNPSTGSDEGDGATLGTALKSFHELVRRFGSNPIDLKTASITIVGTNGATPLDVAIPNWNLAGALTIKGDANVANSGTLSAVVNRDIATRTRAEVTGPAAFGSTARGSIQHLRVEWGGGGNGWVTVWDMGGAPGPSIYVNAATDIPVVGDNYEVIDLPAVNLLELNAGSFVVAFEDLDIEADLSTEASGYVQLKRCRVDGFWVADTMMAVTECRVVGNFQRLQAAFDWCAFGDDDNTEPIFTSCTVELRGKNDAINGITKLFTTTGA